MSRANVNDTENEHSMMMPTLTLNNGVEIPALGLGVFQSGPEETVAAVTTAPAVGYRLINTAAAYMNEEQAGQGIRESGVPRATRSSCRRSSG
jgi:2,5-diketo-D-gluconate reductase A